jgi:hypothetical protein
LASASENACGHIIKKYEENKVLDPLQLAKKAKNKSKKRETHCHNQQDKYD